MDFIADVADDCLCLVEVVDEFKMEEDSFSAGSGVAIDRLDCIDCSPLLEFASLEVKNVINIWSLIIYVLFIL